MCGYGLAGSQTTSMSNLYYDPHAHINHKAHIRTHAHTHRRNAVIIRFNEPNGSRNMSFQVLLISVTIAKHREPKIRAVENFYAWQMLRKFFGRNESMS